MSSTDYLAPLLNSYAQEALDRLERRARGEEKPISMPFSDLAALLGGGLWAPSLTILAAGTGMGKTQFALQNVLHAAEQGVPVLYIGLEANPMEIIARVAGIHC